MRAGTFVVKKFVQEESYATIGLVQETSEAVWDEGLFDSCTPPLCAVPELTPVERLISVWSSGGQKYSHVRSTSNIEVEM